VSGLQRFEQRLEELVSGVFARAFRSAVQPVEIAAALHRELDNNAQILSRQRRIVPNDFHVELSATDLARLAPYDSALADDLTHQVQEYAEEQGYVFPGPVAIAFEPAQDLTTGRFRLRSKPVAGVSGGTMTDTQAGRAQAYLDVNGTKHPLQPGSLVIGRGSEADLRINDPGVSRRHVEFRTEFHSDGPQVAVYDLGSTNGMHVNGQKMASALLDDGSQVRVGSTTMTVRVVR
jgi:hypothetical protein